MRAPGVKKKIVGSTRSSPKSETKISKKSRPCDMSKTGD